MMPGKTTRTNGGNAGTPEATASAPIARLCRLACVRWVRGAKAPHRGSFRLLRWCPRGGRGNAVTGCWRVAGEDDCCVAWATVGGGERDGLNVALNEATWAGIGVDAAGRRARLLLD